MYGSRPDEQEDREVRDRRRDEVREDQVEDDQVEHRVEQRPHEPERAVLVLDLQLLAHEGAEELAVRPDVAEPPDRARTCRHLGPVRGTGLARRVRRRWWPRREGFAPTANRPESRAGGRRNSGSAGRGCAPAPVSRVGTGALRSSRRRQASPDSAIASARSRPEEPLVAGRARRPTGSRHSTWRRPGLPERRAELRRVERAGRSPPRTRRSRVRDRTAARRGAGRAARRSRPCTDAGRRCAHASSSTDDERPRRTTAARAPGTRRSRRAVRRARRRRPSRRRRDAGREHASTGSPSTTSATSSPGVRRAPRTSRRARALPVPRSVRSTREQVRRVAESRTACRNAATSPGLAVGASSVDARPDERSRARRRRTAGRRARCSSSVSQANASAARNMWSKTPRRERRARPCASGCSTVGTRPVSACRPSYGGRGQVREEDRRRRRRPTAPAARPGAPGGPGPACASSRARRRAPPARRAPSDPLVQRAEEPIVSRRPRAGNRWTITLAVGRRRRLGSRRPSRGAGPAQLVATSTSWPRAARRRRELASTALPRRARSAP